MTAGRSHAQAFCNRRAMARSNPHRPPGVLEGDVEITAAYEVAGDEGQVIAEGESDPRASGA